MRCLGISSNKTNCHPTQRVLVFVPQWADRDAYKETLLKLGGLFRKNFEVFADYQIGEDNKLTEEILAAGPIF